MASTPSPPRRVHTPPAPHHGALHDSYEPYSPRRSNRVAAQRSTHPQQNCSTSSTKQHFVRATTPTNAPVPVLARTSSQTFSPPSSPASPQKRVSVKSPRTLRRQRIVEMSLPHTATDSDSDAGVPPSKLLKPSTAESFGMLPTPSKTPRKRPVESEAALNSTARVLFPSRPATVEDAMPVPKKTCKSKHSAFTLGGFAEEGDEEAGPSKIPIYTDSKERVPSLDANEENPFIGPRETRGRAKRSGKANLMKRLKGEEEDDSTAWMDEAVRNEEGLIYVFRGKKVFRKFSDHAAHSSSDEANDSPTEQIKRRKPTSVAALQRPFTRSTLRPRLLWPGRRHHRTAEQEAEEEAATDIEIPVPVSRAGKNNTAATLSKTVKTAPHFEEVDEEEFTTPAKQHLRSTTPPPTGRRETRSSAKKEASSAPELLAVPGVDEDAGPSWQPPRPAKKPSPFDAWRRTKTGARSGKREGGALEREGEAKRVRSEASEAGL